MKWIGLTCVAAACVAAVCLTDVASATTFVLMSEQQLAVGSDAAVLGSVTQIETVQDPETRGVHTYIHIEPSEMVFGSLPDGELVLRERGGNLDDIREWVFGTPEYTLGEEVLVFVVASPDGVLHTTGMAMGKYTVTQSESSGAKLHRDLGEGTRLFQPGTGRLVSNPAPETYDLDTFVTTVRRAASTTRERRRGDRRRAIQLTPPELEEASVREWQESFTYLGSPARWFEPDTDTAIGYFIDQTGDSLLGLTSSRAAVDAAFAAWSSAASSSLRMVDSGVTSPLAYAGCTSTNRVAFNDPWDEIEDPVDCSGILAIGGYCSTGTTRVVNGTTFRKIVNGKVMFNDGWDGCSGWTQCNLAEVAAHELGHTLGIGHSNDSFATMSAYAHFDGRCAGLEDDDIAAIEFMYPASVVQTLTPTPSATHTHSPRPTPTMTITLTVTQTGTATQTPTQTRTPTVTSRPTSTARPTSTSRPTPTTRPTETSTATVTPTGTETPIPTSTPTATPTSPPLYRISGQIRYYGNANGVPGATVRLSGENETTTETTDSGAYAFDNITSGVWQIEPQGMTGGDRAVSALDAAYVLQAAVGTRTLTPMQQLACDVTGDGSVSSFDAARILQYTVSAITALPVSQACDSSWLFIPSEQSGETEQTVQPIISGGDCQNGRILLQPLANEMINQDFDAVRFGDCTGNWQPDSSNSALQPSSIDEADAVVQIGRPRRKTSSTVRLPIYVRPTDPIQALNISLQYDPSQLEPINVTARRPSPATLLQFEAQTPGQLNIAVASGRNTTRRRSALFAVEFAVHGSSPTRHSVRLSRITIDENPPIVVQAGESDRRR